jgi:hypothetical protein
MLALFYEDFQSDQNIFSGMHGFAVLYGEISITTYNPSLAQPNQKTEHGVTFSQLTLLLNDNKSMKK